MIISISGFNSIFRITILNWNFLNLQEQSPQNPSHYLDFIYSFILGIKKPCEHVGFQ